MLRYIIPLIESYCSGGMFQYILFPILALAILATIPYIITAIIEVR